MFDYNNPYSGMQMPMNNFGYPNNFQPRQTQQFQMPMQNTNKIFVSGIDEVKMRMLSPNSDFIFLDNEKSILYQKTVDSSGHFEVKAFDIVEHKESTGHMESLEYVSKKDFEDLKSEFKALYDKVNGGQING